MKKLMPTPSHDACYNEHVIEMDFLDGYTSGDGLTTVATDSGTAAATDATGGVMTITPSDGTVADNDEIYLKGTTESLLFGANRDFEVVARLKFTEANTDDANVVVGCMNAVAANSLLDNGAGPPNTSNHAVFFKVDGAAYWNFETSISTTQTTSRIADVTTAGDGTYRWFRILVESQSASRILVTPFINGVQCRDYTTGAPIQHVVDASSNATEMQRIVGMKNGDTTNVETLYLDYIRERAVRA